MVSFVSRRSFRSAYSLSELAELAGISVDDLLEKYIQHGALDIYVWVPSKYTAYSLVRNYLALEPHGFASVIRDIRIQPDVHKEIEALRLSRGDCQKLVSVGRVEQMLFGAGLEKTENMDSVSGGYELEPVLLRDWHFIPGQLERFEREFGYGKELSESSRDALEKGVLFRRHPEHIEGGGASDFCFWWRGRGPLYQRYEYFFGLYASRPSVNQYTGIPRPEALDIVLADVFVTREDADEFLEANELLSEVQDGLAGTGSSKTVGQPLKCPDSTQNLRPDESWSYWLKALFDISKEIWGRADPLVSDTWPSKSAVVSKIRAKDFGKEMISEGNAEQAATLITPLWARTNTPEAERMSRGVDILTPEFEKMALVAKRIQESMRDEKSKPLNNVTLKKWLMDDQHCSLSGAGADTAVWLVKLKRSRAGAPKKTSKR